MRSFVHLGVPLGLDKRTDPFALHLNPLLIICRILADIWRLR